MLGEGANWNGIWGLWSIRSGWLDREQKRITLVELNGPLLVLLPHSQ